MRIRRSYQSGALTVVMCLFALGCEGDFSRDLSDFPGDLDASDSTDGDFSDSELDAGMDDDAGAIDASDETPIGMGGPGDVEGWRPMVELYFPPDQVENALAVMACESSGDPDAKNPNSSASGLFQFLTGTWDWASVEAGWAGYSPFHPEANVASAAWLVDYSIRTDHPRGAWGHWSCQP